MVNKGTQMEKPAGGAAVSQKLREAPGWLTAGAGEGGRSSSDPIIPGWTGSWIPSKQLQEHNLFFYAKVVCLDLEMSAPPTGNTSVQELNTTISMMWHHRPSNMVLLGQRPRIDVVTGDYLKTGAHTFAAGVNGLNQTRCPLVGPIPTQAQPDSRHSLVESPPQPARYGHLEVW